MQIFKQPLLHFLVLGLLIFLLFEMTEKSSFDEGKTIVINREKLVDYLGFRSKSLNKEQIESSLDTMSLEKVAELIKEYVEEESLYRESLALGLDSGDYVLRQRLVQKMEYLIQLEVPHVLDSVEEYYEKNKERYYVKSTFTFTHVFVNRELYESNDVAVEVASTLLRKLKSDGVSFAEALQLGDRFTFHKNYVGKTEGFIASQLGEAFASVVARSKAGEWFGPVESAFGYHLVLVSNREQGRVPPLEEILRYVTFDAQQAESELSLQEAIDAIVEDYEVIVNF
jgi:hypothetical protein